MKSYENLKISVRHTLNGDYVRHIVPRDTEYDGWEQMTPDSYTYSFEHGRDPHFYPSDRSRCLHYHIGYIIDDITCSTLGKEGDRGYDIEIVIKSN